ncbi:MFS transporter [Mobilitalea sibirica]|uniref:MFS transporter n=1 Tax=Mobilitalea sibirica TaxID=1462919 RepID=A0A8J7L2K2_9FIRM|nr:MFS transporter [Mobilitalea sibirica]MBH1940808.1 MFS transporter [Mobilitalea sibirica]
MDTKYENTKINGLSLPYEINSSKEKFNLILFSLGKTVSLLGTYIYSFAISLYILRVTGSGMSFALSILIGTLPRVILSPVAGSLSDRVDKKKLIVILDFLSGTVVLALLTLSFLYGLRIPFIYIATLLLAIISTFFNTCFSAAIPRLVYDHNLVKINSYNRAIDSGSQVLGPILAGLVFGFVSINLFLFINGVSFLLSAISELFINFNLNSSTNQQKPTGNMSMKSIGEDIKEVFAYIKTNKVLCRLIPFSMTFNFLITASLTVIFPFLVINTLKMSSIQYGLIEGAFSVGMLFAAIVIGKLPEKEKKRKDLTRGIIGMGASLIIMGLPGLSFLSGLNTHVVFSLYLIMAVTFAFFLLLVDLPLQVVTQRSIPEHMLGRVMGILAMISSSLMPLGIILAGVTMEIIPAYFLFFITGFYFILSALFMYKSKAMQEY